MTPVRPLPCDRAGELVKGLCERGAKPLNARAGVFEY